MEHFAGRAAAITGGADGIGRALAEALAGAGMRVAILDVRGDAAHETAAAIGRGAIGVECDVTLSASLEAAASALRAEFGTLAIFCANAGVGAAGGMLTASPRAIDWVFAVNARGLIDSLRGFVPLMREGPRHAVVTASSASLTSPGAALGLYGGSKHATMGIAEAAASELAEMGIGATILCPGLINTRIWDGARARPDHFGGPRSAPEETGDHWRSNGMDVNWVAACTLKAIAKRERYCAPLDASQRIAFDARADAIRSGMHFWQDRDRARWPDIA